VTYTSDTRVVKAARKAHVCDWCGEAIEIGSSYATWTGVFDGQWGVTKVHPECHRGMNAMPHGDLADGWLVGDYERGTDHEKGCGCEPSCREAFEESQRRTKGATT
jgi:hypothetical protein